MIAMCFVCFRAKHGSEYAARAFVDAAEKQRVFRLAAIRWCDVAQRACIPTTASHVSSLRLTVARRLSPAGEDINRPAVRDHKC